MSGGMQMKQRTKKGIFLISIILIVLTGGGFFYLTDSYSPAPEALSAMDSSTEVEVVKKENYSIFLPQEGITEDGLIFYQGGKVEAEAYAPLMQALAEKGVAAYLVEMPFNLAVFDVQAADEVIHTETSIKNWYLAGHSLGGAMASSYAENHAEELAGLMLLAAYSAVDLTATELPTLMIYGTADEVMNQEKYEESRSLVPQMQEVVLEGGNHAQFGRYGKQTGDGEASLSARNQLEQTVDAMIQFIQETTSE